MDEAATARVRERIERLIREGSLVSRLDGATHDVRRVSIPLDEGEALRRWVEQERAGHTIEIGLGYGLSALFLCEGLLRNDLPGTRHVAVDPFQDRRFARCGLQVLEEAGVDGLVEHHAEISQVVLPALLAQGRRFDLGFVDGNHRFDFVFLDLFYLGRLLRPGGVVILDDYDLPGVRRAVSFFLTNLAWSIEETAGEGDGRQWVVVRTARGEDTRDFRHFEEF